MSGKRASADAAAGHEDFARLIELPSGRKVYLECRGRGSPTVVFVSASGNAADIWSFRKPGSSQTPVLPAVARFTRVAVYARVCL